jgi:hypothetical protein
MASPEKKKARKVKKGKRYVATANKLKPKALSNKLSPKRRKQVKGDAQAKTAYNLAKAGTDIQKSGGQGTLPKRRKLKVTPRSMHKDIKESRNYKGKKSARKARSK